MTQLFGVPIDIMTTILVVATAIIIGGTLLLALTNAIFFKIGVRNIPRRRAQMLLIVFALMLSTTLLTGVLATGDVITAAGQSVAVYNLGSVDETITAQNNRMFDDYVYKRAQTVMKRDPAISAVGAALVENGLLLADETSRQVRSNVTALALIPNSEKGFGGMQDTITRKTDTIAELALIKSFSIKQPPPCSTRGRAICSTSIRVVGRGSVSNSLCARSSLMADWRADHPIF